MTKFIIMGRVSGNDDIVKIVEGDLLDEAKIAFENHLKTTQNWSFGTDIYIEFAKELYSELKSMLHTTTINDIKSQYENALLSTDKESRNIALVTAYEAATSFNPYDLADLASTLYARKIGESLVFEVDQENNDELVVCNNETAFDTSTHLATFYFLFWAFLNNKEELLKLYNCDDYLQQSIGAENHSDISFTELSAFPKK
jgi:hypothetical protein